jgi:hypothetical protein
MDYTFQCPQGDTLYTDNVKLRGYAKRNKIMKWDLQQWRLLNLRAAAILFFQI